MRHCVRNIDGVTPTEASCHTEGRRGRPVPFLVSTRSGVCSAALRSQGNGEGGEGPGLGHRKDSWEKLVIRFEGE